MTRVSVISVFYNRAGMVDDTVRSLQEQTLEDCEILLVDDGSGDDTLARLRQWESHRTRVLTGPNQGLVNCLNQAVRQAKGQYIAIHGSGDIALPRRLEVQSRLLDERPEVGVAGCLSEVVTLQSTRPPHIVSRAFEGDARQRILRWNPFHHGEVMFRKSLFEAVGGYRPFFVCGQDRDLWCRMSTQARFAVVDEVLYRKFAKVPGSVAADPHRLLLQRYLSDFAVFCHRERLAGRPDPLDHYGDQGALFRPPSRELSRSLLVIGARFVAAGEMEHARLFCLRAGQESGYLPALALGWAIDRAPGLILRLARSYQQLARLGQRSVAAAGTGRGGR